MNIALLIILIVWIIGIPIAYFSYFKKQEAFDKAEKIFYSIVWPAIIVLFILIQIILLVLRVIRGK